MRHLSRSSPEADFCVSYALQLGKAACDKVQRLALRANEEAEKLGFLGGQSYAVVQHLLGVDGKSPIKL